ncbi:hypothetical protein ACP275_05G054400 [Erythranthe tilingii]
MAQSLTPSTQMSVDSESQADRADKTHEVAEPYSQAAAQEQAAPPASLNLSLSLPIIALVVRIITLVCLILSISLMASNSTSIRIDTVDLTPSNSTTFLGIDGDDYDKVEVISIRFNDIYAYRYGLSTAVIGMAYTLLQLGYSIYQVMSGKRLTVNHPTLVVYEFVGDKVILSLIATGVGAIFGATLDLMNNIDKLEDAYEKYLEDTTLSPFRTKLDNFFSRAYIPAMFLLIAFITCGVSSVLSSFGLNKKTQ